MKARDKQASAVTMAILAALCYGFSVPLSKLLLTKIPSILLASLLYLGAGIGMSFLHGLTKRNHTAQTEAKLSRKDLPFTLGMIVLDIAAPILLLLGLSQTSAGNVSLLSNFEIVATALIALLLFKEAVGRRMWLVLLMVTLACLLLSINDFQSFTFSIGSLYVLLACCCWGLENNLTRMLSLKNPMQIVILKGFGSGTGALIAAAAARQLSADALYILLALLLGFVAYGLSIYFYIHAQRHLGAVRTGAYYAFAPFIGVGLSAILFGQPISLPFVFAFALMSLGAFLAAREQHTHTHKHEPMEHEHRHSHDDGHHTHTHAHPVQGEHSHVHIHNTTEHTHPHTPDLHHTHRH